MQPRSSQHVPVVIIGAGPTGIAAANMLGQRGISCLVIERHREIYPLPRTVHFDDEVFRILASMGLSDEVAAITRPMRGLQLLDARRRPFVRFHRNPNGGHHGHPEANTFEQPALEQVLRRGLSRYPHVELRCGTEVVTVDEPGTDRPAPIRLTLRDTRSGRLTHISASYLLGCDGANSRTRAIVDTELEDLGFTQSWLLIDAQSEQPLHHWDGVHQVCDPNGAVTYMRVSPTRYRWQFQLKSNPQHVPTTEDAARRLAPWLTGVDPAQVTIIRQTVFTFRAVIARRWRRGRIFLLGDAAHQAPPFLGQGMCAGIRDAANLTWKLALVLSGHAQERLLETYQAERRPHARRMVQLAARQGWLLTGGPLRTAAVKTILRNATRLPAVHQRLSRSTCPPLTAGPLVQPSPPGVRRPRLAGRLCPQPRVTTPSGTKVPLDTVLGDGFSILAHGTDWIPSTQTAAHNFGVRLVAVLPDDAPPPEPPDGQVTFIRDTTGILTKWLNEGQANAVLLRPDRYVLAAGPTPELPAWRHTLTAGGIPDRNAGRHRNRASRPPAVSHVRQADYQRTVA